MEASAECKHEWVKRDFRSEMCWWMNQISVILTRVFPHIRIKTVLIAQAEAEKIRRIGEAQASSISAVGKAEAEKMRLKAEAYQQYGDAAKTALVLEALPKVKHGLVQENVHFDWLLNASKIQFFTFLWRVSPEDWSHCSPLSLRYEAS